MDRMGRKKCNEELIQKQTCYGAIAECHDREENVRKLLGSTIIIS